jgi:muramoyltetrapeptide carboxypeptidase
MYLAPRKLRRGSRVAIVAPASPIHSDRLMEGLDILREAGLIPILGPCVKNLITEGCSSAPLKDRVDELNWAFGAPEISGVICALGGEGSAALLPHLDYGMIRNSRKPFLGRSDITALNTGLLTHAGLISINGQTPSIHLDRGEQVRKNESESFFHTLRLMMSDEPWGSRPFEKNSNVLRTVSPGVTQGIAVGGNVDTFTRLFGTPHMHDLEGTIVFIEDVHKGGTVLDREFLHMQLAGVMDTVSGFVIGEFQDAEKNSKINIEDVVQKYFAGSVPCSFGHPFSHGSVVAPIPIGAMCTLDADSCEVSFDFSMG